MRHDCPQCEMERAVVLRLDEAVCATCGEAVEFEDLVTPEEALTDRDLAALEAPSTSE